MAGPVISDQKRAIAPPTSRSEDDAERAAPERDRVHAGRGYRVAARFRQADSPVLA